MTPGKTNRMLKQRWVGVRAHLQHFPRVSRYEALRSAVLVGQTAALSASGPFLEAAWGRSAD